MMTMACAIRISVQDLYHSQDSGKGRNVEAGGENMIAISKERRVGRDRISATPKHSP